VEQWQKYDEHPALVGPPHLIRGLPRRLIYPYPFIPCNCANGVPAEAHRGAEAETR
jgi:hypothetical protein